MVTGLQGAKGTAMEKWHRKLGDKDVGGVLASELRSRGWVAFEVSHVFKEGIISRIIASRHAAAMRSGLAQQLDLYDATLDGLEDSKHLIGLW